MIKEVPVDDLDRAAELGIEFFREANLPGSLKPEVFKKNWKYFIEIGMGKILGVYKDGIMMGAIGMLITPDVNDGEMVASEAFWFINKDHRGEGVKLLLYFLKYAKEIGCVRVNMVHLFNHNQEKLSKFYLKLGFAPIEIHYVKSL